MPTSSTCHEIFVIELIFQAEPFEVSKKHIYIQVIDNVVELKRIVQQIRLITFFLLCDPRLFSSLI